MAHGQQGVVVVDAAGMCLVYRGERVDTHATSNHALRQATPCDTVGALNLYGKNRYAVTTADVHDDMALAAHVGVAVAGAQELENLEKALSGRTVIGQATGILMERFDPAPERAFGVLTRIPKDKNLKLRQLAGQIVQTWTVPKE